MLQHYQHQTHNNCPQCGIPNESTAHIIQCQDNGAKTLWNVEMCKLEQWMLDNDGHPEMVESICNRLRAWQSMKDTINPSYSDSVLSLAITQQQRLGWFNFIQGYLSIQWRVCQSSHLITIKSKKSALLWMP
jgi:hypothetical protein